MSRLKENGQKILHKNRLVENEKILNNDIVSQVTHSQENHKLVSGKTRQTFFKLQKDKKF
jgi:hypothetical protein